MNAIIKSWLLAVLLLADPFVFAVSSVQVGMQAAFTSPPYLLELLETAAGENATAYFPLLDRIAGGNFNTAKSDAALYEQFVNIVKSDGHITSPEALATFNLALSLRSATPRIEAQFQHSSTVSKSIREVETGNKCRDWILFEGKRYCTPQLDEPWNEKEVSITPKSLPFDRVLGHGKEAILYADIRSPGFPILHQTLAASARKWQLSYKLRYRHNDDESRPALPVSGYGVELALKRTDYIVIDDREDEVDNGQKPLTNVVELDETEELADLKPLSQSELISLGVKAASFVMHSESPLDALVKLTQDFPKFSASIAAHEVSEAFVKEREENIGQRVPGGINYLWINGMQLTERQIQPHGLVDILRRERNLIDAVRSLGFNAKEVVSLLGHESVSSAKAEDAPTRYDWTDKLEDGKAILWLNDLENDERYEEYSKSLMALMQRTYPGQLPPIGINIFHVIAPADLTNIDDLALLSQFITLISRGVPLRFGLIPYTATEEARAQAKVVYYMNQNFGSEVVTTYLNSLHQSFQTSIQESLINGAIEDRAILPNQARLSIDQIAVDETLAEHCRLARDWSRRLNTDTQDRPIFINGLSIPRDGKWMQLMSSRLGEDLQIVQQALYQGLIDEETWIPSLFLEGALPSRNVYIAPEDDKLAEILDMNMLYKEHEGFINELPLINADAESSKESWAALTVVTDLTADDGVGLLLAAIQFRRENHGVRLEFIHNPAKPHRSGQINSTFKLTMVKLQEADTIDDIKNLRSTPVHDDQGIYMSGLTNFLAAAKISAGTTKLILNGRVIGPILTGMPFTKEMFQELLEYEQKHRILPVLSAIDSLGVNDRLSDPIATAKLTSLLARSTVSDTPAGIFESASDVRLTLYDSWESEHTAIEIGDAQKASIHLVAILDPISEQGQRWASILKTLSEMDGIYLKIFLNPKDRLSELPIKRFFRYVMQSKPSFDNNGSVEPFNATFSGLPSETLLTAGMDLPPAWLVAPSDSTYDLDNIKLASSSNDIKAIYELENILIEGHSREGKGGAPRGAQLVLQTEKEESLTDTIIMSNLGYFQFKANPGIYKIQLKEGQTADIYDIESLGAKGYSPIISDESTDVALVGFQGMTLYPRLKRKVGMETADVLERSDDVTQNIVSKGIKLAGNLFGTGKPTTGTEAEHAEINIFSVASGHLYERMLNIMMVSVMENTKHSVKFWFIEQFLSPSFKEFIPHLAKEYGFKYEMVTYKWPHWLRQQNEKQREIWGYKILFLDVLFPLSLDKVIFVDADQIVRTDMIDLVNHDLEGAPYAFTPMCDSRTEMEGFRFWKQGYWATYLRGKPYHISALYVVDLRRFRELAAGDRLRQQYQALSADPGSLANLDQDLPNHMQFTIPIHSLPQEWLWCETWCSDEALTSARTIDLCNNPETKEPKLDRARRQVPEWTVYDDEIADLDRRRKSEKLTSEKGERQNQDINIKSRRMEEPSAAHAKDEL